MYLSIENLCFSYPSAKEKTIQSFTMTIDKGELISILGRSGSGKSTILRILAGLEYASEGSFCVNDEVLFDNQTFIQPEKRGIGMVFQDYALFPHMTVGKNILFGISHLAKEDRRKRLSEVLELVEMESYENRYPHQLSGGQQQRIALARALAPNPRLLLLDEPFSNLDTALQVKIRRELRDILKRANITSIFVTHDEDDAHAIADRIVKLNRGKIEQMGNPCDILKEETKLVYS